MSCAMISHMGIYLRNSAKGCTCAKPRKCQSDQCHWYWRKRVNGRLVCKALSTLEITTEAEARAFEREAKKQQLAKRLAELDPSLRTLAALKDEYIKQRKGQRFAHDTIRKDGYALDSLMSVLGGQCRLRTINQRRVDEWAKVLLAGDVSPNTINSYLRHIRAALNTAESWGWLKKVPKLKGQRSPKRLPRALTPREMARVLWYEKNFERRALWRLFLWTGARRQEVIDLQWQDVHLDDPDPWVRLVGKGDKERVVPLLPQAIEALGVMPRYDLGPVWRFQVKRTLRPVKGWALSKWFKQAAVRAGINDAHLHDMRHTAATWMIARGVNMRAVQAVLGHSSITVTQAYTEGVARLETLAKELKRGL